jgi:hypothetical protein
MAMSRVRVQAGLSMAQFLDRYFGEAMVRAPQLPRVQIVRLLREKAVRAHYSGGARQDLPRARCSYKSAHAEPFAWRTSKGRFGTPPCHRRLQSDADFGRKCADHGARRALDDRSASTATDVPFRGRAPRALRSTKSNRSPSACAWQRSQTLILCASPFPLRRYRGANYCMRARWLGLGDADASAWILPSNEIACRKTKSGRKASVERILDLSDRRQRRTPSRHHAAPKVRLLVSFLRHCSSSPCQARDNTRRPRESGPM